LRLTAPFIVFAVALAAYLAVDYEAAWIVSALPNQVYPAAQIITGIAVWLVGAWFATAIFRELVIWFTRRRGLTTKLPKLLVDVGAIVFFFIAALAIVSQVFNQPLGGLLATSGVLAAIIGFSVQKTIADVVAGVGLNLEQTIKLGDWIETSNGAIGKVHEISWRTTHLETIEGHLVVVPNSILSAGQFSNLSAPERRLRIKRAVSIDYDVPSDRVVKILDSAMQATSGVLAAPAPIVFIDNLADSGIVYSMNFWVEDYGESFLVARNVVINALKFLDQAGITPNYPHNDVTLFEPRPRRIDRKIDIVAILTQMPFFASFEADALEHIRSESALLEYPPQSVIVREGDAGSSLFVVVAGLLDVTKQVPGRPNRQLGRLQPGDILGEMSLLTGAARSATVTAATHSILLEIEKQQIEPVLASHPEAIASLGRLIASRAAANESLLAIWPEERQEIARMGVAAFLRGKIAEFFGRALS